MSNYYEELGLTPQSKESEIQSAIDNRYNEWRQLATHPDPTIVEEANRNLRLLEQVRMTLTDPVRRTAYDAGIGLAALGGLADPSAVLRQSNTPPPKPKSKPDSATTQERNPWQCTKCGVANPVDTIHCQQCGTKLSEPCPQCGRIAPVSARFCGSCGVDLAYARAERNRQLAEQEERNRQAQIAVKLEQITAEETQIEVNNRVANRGLGIPVFWFWFFLMLFTPIFWIMDITGIGGEIKNTELEDKSEETEYKLLKAGGGYYRSIIYFWALYGVIVVLHSAVLYPNFDVMPSIIAGMILFVFFFIRVRRKAQRGAGTLNATHQQRIIQLEEEMRVLREQ